MRAPILTKFVVAAFAAVVFVSGAAAQSIGWYSASKDTFTIATADDLAGLAFLVNNGNSDFTGKTVILANDVDLKDYGSGYNEGRGWNPIGGGVGRSFNGTFDGNGKTVSGLFINDTAADNVGLFGRVVNGIIKNVGVVGVDVTGKNYVGGAVGFLNISSLIESYVTGTVNGKYCAGGAVGSSTGSPSSGSSNIGYCYFDGAVKGIDNVGGISGIASYGTVQYCYSIGEVEGNDNTGGLTGSMAFVGVISSYSVSTVKGNNSVGGLVGHASTGASISNSAALNPSVTGGERDNSAGRVVGVQSSGIQNVMAFNGMAGNFADSTVSASGMNGANVSKYDIFFDNTIKGLFSDTSNAIWTVEPNKLPGLFGKAVDMPEYLVVDDAPEALWYTEKPSADTFYIATAADLASLAYIVNAGVSDFFGKTVMLTADISLSAYGSGFNGGKGWIPIGNSYANMFSGVFDGNGKTVSGLYINAPDADTVGLFGVVGYYTTLDNLVTVKNLGVANADVTGDSIVGAVVGLLGSSALANTYATGKVSGKDYVGGLAGGFRVTIGDRGGSQKSRVSGCYFSGAVSGAGDNVGGLAGASSADINDCYSAGTVSGKNNVGGLIGYIHADIWRSQTVKTCYSISGVSGYDNVGGIIGTAQVTTNSSNVITLSNLVALNSGVTASRNSIDVNIGRVVGSIENDGIHQSGTAENPSFTQLVPRANLIAFSGMNGTFSDLTGPETKNGDDITETQIKVNLTIRNTFIDDSIWTLEPEKLPGLLGRAVNMPVHLGGTEVSVAQSDRAIPSGQPDETAALAPVTVISGEFSAGPSPAAKPGAVNFFWTGKTVKSGTLSVFDASGNLVKKISVSANGRNIGSWDLTDSKGRPAAEGTYLVKGVIKTTDGKSEKVSFIVGVK